MIQNSYQSVIPIIFHIVTHKAVSGFENKGMIRAGYKILNTIEGNLHCIFLSELTYIQSNAKAANHNKELIGHFHRFCYNSQ